MMEFIEKGKAIEEMLRRYWDGKETLREIVQSIPAADVRPVVLCRDCMFRQYCKIAQYLVEDGFCSNGEKRDES